MIYGENLPVIYLLHIIHVTHISIDLIPGFWCSKTDAMDLFTQFWGHDLNWLVPPPAKVAMTIHKMRQDHAKGTLLSQNGNLRHVGNFSII